MIPKYKPAQKESSRQNIFFTVLLCSFILIVLSFLIVSNIRINLKRNDLNAQIERLKEEIRAAEEKKQQLEAQANQSGHQDYLEKEARENFNLKKPGEEVVTVVPEEKDKE